MEICCSAWTGKGRVLLTSASTAKDCSFNRVTRTLALLSFRRNSCCQLSECCSSQLSAPYHIRLTTKFSRVPTPRRSAEVLAAGVREKQIAFLKVKVYAVAVYVEDGIRSFLASWHGKEAADLAKDDALYKVLTEAPFEKALEIVLARDVDGATFWGALDEALVPRLKAADNGVHGEAALADFGKVFQGRALKQGTRIILAWVQPSNLKIAIAASLSANPVTEATINSRVLLFALFDVFLGSSAVSKSAKASVADGIAVLV
ncbi:hypothetical protein CY35_14G095400 [Sphagnum magellanicum]|nr:hypothetical protein CY35_14G095400 [Sphagnum magellanicum]